MTKWGTLAGGEGGIRTHDTLARIPVFETGTFNHSATSPGPAFYHFPGDRSSPPTTKIRGSSGEKELKRPVFANWGRNTLKITLRAE